MLMSATFLVSAVLQFALALVVAAILGPHEFGLYALVLAGGVLLQSFLLDGLRLAATRHHHAHDETGLRPLLERLYGRIGLALVAISIVMAFIPVERASAYALAPLIALVNGFAEFRLALFRAEFDDKRFMRFMVSRNTMAMIVTPVAAVYFIRAEAALLAFLLATLVATSIEEWKLPKAQPATQEPPALAELMRYSAPIVLTNGLYLGFFFALRAGVAWFGGLAMAGQFSLALEFVLKLFSTMGTALDLALFPLALKAERETGMAAAQAQARANLELVIAVLAPMAMGLMLVAPGLEPLLVAPAFRGAFANFVTALCPGVALYALVQYALHPFAQLRHKTGVLIVAAASALLVGGCALLALKGIGLSSLTLALLLMSAMLAATLVLWRQAGREALPSIRFVVSLIACLSLLGLVVAPFAMNGFTLPLLIAAVLLGALAYAGGAFALDLAGLKTLLNAGRKPAQ